MDRSSTRSHRLLGWGVTLLIVGSAGYGASGPRSGLGLVAALVSLVGLVVALLAAGRLRRSTGPEVGRGYPRPLVDLDALDTPRH